MRLEGNGRVPESQKPKDEPVGPEGLSRSLPFVTQPEAPIPPPPLTGFSTEERAPLAPMAGRWPTFEPRLDILPPTQLALWPYLRQATRMGFVLYGGTAIALRLGHRESIDFDFFTDRPFDYLRLIERMPFLERATVLQEEADTLTVRADPEDPNQAPVKVSFFNVGVGRIGIPEMTSDQVGLVASLQDLMAHKLKVVLQRVERKDYLDIHALMTHGESLAEGLAGARALFGRAFQPAEALKALTYYQGGDLHDLPARVQTDLIAAVARVENLPAPPRVDRDLTGGRQ